MSKFTISSYATNERVRQMIELDKQVYIYNEIGNFDLCKQWLSVNPNIYTMLLEEDKVVGYINFVPLTNESYEAYKQNKLQDYQLTTSDVLPFESGKQHNCLIMSFVVDKKYRNTNASAVLISAFTKKIKALNKKGVVINNVICDCVSDEGINLAQKLNFKVVKELNKRILFEGKFDV